MRVARWSEAAARAAGGGRWEEWKVGVEGKGGGEGSGGGGKGGGDCTRLNHGGGGGGCGEGGGGDGGGGRGDGAIGGGGGNDGGDGGVGGYGGNRGAGQTSKPISLKASLNTLPNSLRKTPTNKPQTMSSHAGQPLQQPRPPE